MSVWPLENDRFLVAVHATGAELSSIRDKLAGREWLWQPRPGVWNNSATMLFPVVGALVHEGVRVDGQFLPLSAHGFLRGQTFTCIEQSVNHLVLEARATPETLGLWPWCWRVQLQIALHEDGLSVRQHVFNDDLQSFWYSIGWHPGFALPVASKTGWHVKFGEKAVRGPFTTRNRMLVTEGQNQKVTSFPLTEASFRDGAIYFGDCQQQQVLICSPDGTIVMTLETAEHDWLALWSVPGADLLCIEPLAGTTDAPDFDGNAENKRGIRHLAPGQSQVFSVRLRFAVDAHAGIDRIPVIFHAKGSGAAMSVNRENVRVYISNVLGGLGETDQHIARFILEQSAAVAQMPVRKLAEAMSVSEATIVRFCKKIGYTGLLELKAALKRELLDDREQVLPSSPDIFLDDTRNDVAQKIAMTVETTLNETIGLLDMKVVNPVVERFLTANRVLFVGFGASGLSAMEARDKMNRQGIDSEAYTDRFTMTLKLANLKPEDLVVAFSHSGETPEVVNAFRLAKKAGAQCLAITHSPQSPLTELADTWLLTSGSAGPYQGDSIATRMSQLFIIEFLCTEITRHNLRDSASTGLSIKELLIKERIKRESTG